MVPGASSNGRPRLATVLAAAARLLSLNASRFASAAVRRSAFDRSFGKAQIRRYAEYDGNAAGTKTTATKQKCEAAMAVGVLDPGVPYESRWAPCSQVHGPGQGQFPEGSIRPRGYMTPDARHSFAGPM